MERKMFDTPVLPRLATIVAEVKSGDLVVPEFQRPFVWDDDRRLTLLDSIVNGMPIGSLLVWRTTRRDLRTYANVGGVRLEGPRKGDGKINYLIDGHQRISTLFGALYSGDRETSTDDDNTRWPLFYELAARDRPAFRVPPRRGGVPEHWLPLDLLLDGDRLFDFTQRLRQDGRRDLAKEAESLANIFRDYIIPIVPLVTEELDVVTDAFVRINSQGKSMTEAHMLRALTHLTVNDTDRYFENVRVRLEPLGWGSLGDQVLVNVLKAQLGLDVYASSVRGVHQMLQNDPAPLQRLADVLEEAVSFLADVGVRGPGALPYTYQLVTLAALAAQFPQRLSTPEIQGRLRRWFWVTTYTEHFSGITGSRIRDGIEELALGLNTHTSATVDSISVDPLTEIRMSTVRARAFLLFLAQIPGEVEARQRRQECLGMGDTKAAPSLFSSAPSGRPANRVLASPVELRRLRATIRRIQSPTGELESLFRDSGWRPDHMPLAPHEADEYGIPDAALRALPDQDAFLELRGKWLFEQEKVFVERYGLTMIDREQNTG